jgi:hypothetical protein
MKQGANETKVDNHGPEHWLGQKVMISLSGVHPDVAHPVGFLKEMNEAGVTVLISPETKGKPLAGDNQQYVFYPWHRVMLLAREAGTEHASNV